MLMGAGLPMMMADPFDVELKEVIRIIEERDETTPLSRLYLSIHDSIAEMEEPDVGDFDMNDHAAS